MTDKLNFTIKTGLKDIIGKDLITDDNIAVFELVKNSYDAYAKNVIITFEENKIIIADDGKGMSLNDINKKWLAVAYSAKKDGTEDLDEEEDKIKRISYRDKIKSKRYYAGAKGIGRFSADRLGISLILTTKKENSKKIEQLEVNWNDFEQDGKEDFVKIAIPHKTIEKYSIKFPNNSKSGTILEINGANNWDREKIKNLKHSLEKLINPFSETNDFNIEIESEKDSIMDENGIDKKGKKIIDRDKINGNVKNSILDILKLKTTEIDIEVTENEILTTLKDRGTVVYKIREKNNFNPYIDNLKINLYYLNRSAKLNFAKRMGVQPLNYGSVFLFKNGFRVQPYGNTGDDSWELDFRSQQGYGRNLGTRDLFGRVDIVTENAEQFKEVSNREGGLYKSSGYYQLFDIFNNIALKRLTRYVTGVLWGEAFIRKKYFTSESEGLKLRKSLQEYDKDSEDISFARSNVGSKVDFIQLLRSLCDEEDIKILEYNKDLVDLVNDNLEVVQPKFLKDLEKIAETINDEELKKTFLLTDENFKKLETEKEEAERRAYDEEQKRVKAEEEEKRAKKAKEEAEKKAEEAEKKAEEAEKKRIQAELQKEKKERERIQAELEKLKAEAKAKEEQEKREREEEKNKDLIDKLSLEKQKTQYLTATRKTLSEEAEQLVHSIDLYVGNASKFINDIFKEDADLPINLKQELYLIKSNVDKAIKISELIIKSNFDYKNTSNKVELIQYIKEYFQVISSGRESELKIKVEAEGKFLAFLSTIDIDIIIDNLISNSIKADAKNINVELHALDKELLFNYYDDGIGLSEKFVRNPKELFFLGTRDSNKKGSGIGMYDINERLSENKGSIKFIGNNSKLKGVGFQIKFRK